MNVLARIAEWTRPSSSPVHLRYGVLGEKAAKRHLRKLGLKFLIGNYRSPRGEVDLIFRDGDCLVFVEVKTRSSEDWTRPVALSGASSTPALSHAALDYLRLLKIPRIKFRFDIVEVLLADGAISEVRHLPNAFNLIKPYRYG